MKVPRARPRPPLFLPRVGYRKRRLVDAVRLLPLFGGFLLLLPILWAPAETAVGDTARDGMYLFAVWAVLIGAAAWLAPGLADAADEGEAQVPSDENSSDGTKGDH
jgi:hypothetical protein